MLGRVAFALKNICPVISFNNNQHKGFIFIK